MTSLTAWCFPTPLGVDAGERWLRRLEELDAIVVHDAVSVIWMPDGSEPQVRHLRHDTARGGGKGALWGAVLGSLVLAPVAGAAIGGAVGAVRARRVADRIPSEFVEETQRQLVPGSSALLVITSRADPDQVRRMIADTEATLLHAEMGDDVDPDIVALLDERGRSGDDHE